MVTYSKRKRDEYLSQPKVLCSVFYIFMLTNMVEQGLSRLNNQETHSLLFSYALLSAELMLSLEISLFPLLMAIYLPTTKKLFLHVIKTLRRSTNDLDAP